MSKLWMVLEDRYQISLELWLSDKKEYFLVALGGIEADRDRLVALGGKRTTLFRDRIGGGLRCVVFPPAERSISTQQWLSQFPDAHTEEREVSEFFRARPGPEGRFTDEVVLAAIERANHWTAEAEQAEARREAERKAALELEAAVPFFDEPVVSAPTAPAAEAPASAPEPLGQPAPAVIPAEQEIAGAPADTGEQQPEWPPAEQPEGAPEAPVASVPVDAPVTPPSVEAPVPVAKVPAKDVVIQFLEAIHDGDDRPVARLAYDRPALAPELLNKLLENGPSGLLLKCRGLVIPAEIIQRMPRDMQGVLMLFGQAETMVAEVTQMVQSGAWPVVGGAWGTEVDSLDRLILFLDGTLPPSARLTNLSNLPHAQDEQSMAAYINEMWRVTYGQEGQVVQAAASVPKPRSPADLGAGSAAGGVQGVQRASVLAGVEGADGARPDGQASDGPRQGGAEGSGSVRAGGAEPEPQRSDRTPDQSISADAGGSPVRPGAAAGVPGGDDQGLSGRDAEGRRGGNRTAGRGRTGENAADGTERPGSRGSRPGREGDEDRLGDDLVENDAQAEVEELSEEEAAMIAARMQERRRMRTTMMLSVEGDDSREDYVPLSALTAQGVKVPRNLADGMRRALARVQAEHGDIDQFVSAQLGFESPVQLEGRLYAEQVDAIALALRSIAHGRESVLGDLTGIGKGRVLASLIRFAERQEVPVIFVTKDISLFNSMGRELAVMGADYLLDTRHLMLTNSGSVIENEQGNIILEAPSIARLREIYASGEIPAGIKVIFTTHSQLSERPNGLTDQGWVPEQANRSGWLRRVADGAFIISDESHLSAGVDSLCGMNLRAMLGRARWAVHSSATSAKEPKNLALYAGTDLSYLGDRAQLEELLRKGGAAAMEAIPAMLAEEGQYIRREHDMSRADFVYPDISAEIAPRIRDNMDAISSALRLLMRVQDAVSRLNVVANEHEVFAVPNATRTQGGIAAAGRRLGLGSHHFGSTLNHFTSQALFALHADFYADQGIEALRRNEKPVFLVKDTLGAITSELADALIEEGNVPDGSIIETTFAEALLRIARRITTINVNLGPRRQFNLSLLDPLTDAPRSIRGATYRAIMELMRNTQAEVGAFMEGFLEAVRRIPADVPLSPLDRIRQRLEAEGFRMGELTGRKLQMTEIAPGRYRLENRDSASARDRQRIMNSFNSGDLDAILINRAGATGTDLHSDLRFADQRKRNMIVCQVDEDIYVFQQGMGRVFRANQAIPPTYTFPGSAVPVAIRGMSIMRRRLSAMLALTRGSRDAEVADDMPDIFNWVGSEASLNYLRNNPVIAETLGINMNAEEQKAANQYGDTSLANRLTALALLLPCEAQEDLIDGVVREYENRLEDLERRGINPFRSRHMDLKATVVNEEVIYPETGPSVFQSAVKLKEIEYGIEVAPLHGDVIESLLNIGREELTLRGGATRNWSTFPLGNAMARIEENIRERQSGAYDLFLRSQHATIEEARASTHDTVITRLEQHLKMFRSIAPHLGLGTSIELLLGHEHPINLHVVGIKPPAMERELHVPSEWRLRMISTVGHVREVSVPLSTVFQDAIEIQKRRLREADPENPEAPVIDLGAIDRFIFGRGMRNLLDVDGRTIDQDVVREYENAPSGQIRASRYVLGGNLLRAISIAGEEHKGLPSTYTLADGRREYGVIMPSNYDGVRLLNRPVPLTSPDDLVQYIDRAASRSVGVATLPLLLGTPAAEGVTIPQKEKDSTRVNFMMTVKKNPRDNLIEVKLVAPRAKNRSGWMVGYQPLMELLNTKWEKQGSDFELTVMRVRPNDEAVAETATALLNHLKEIGVTPTTSAADTQARRWFCQLHAERAAGRSAGGQLPEHVACAPEV